ncbi:DUF3244 domain-containing protein, partial [Phocaeicola vulgatus]|nr:DUF3244 domain-containing protein [Phocaeicola vulgatus]MDB0795155.1 DUF3244 domain-containing protein [Phocaeicola vulgatus]
PLHLDYTKVIILILWWRNFQLEYWRTFQLVSTIMNKLKMSLALIALIIPLLLCAKKRNIEFIKHGNHRIPVESFIPVKAFFDDCNKELTIEFAQDWEAVTIEIKSKEGYVVYRNLYIPHSNSSLSTSLENIPAGIYELTITDEKGILAGEFIYEN